MFSFCKRLLKRKRKKTEKNSLNKSLNLSAISILYSIPLSLFIKILIIILLACIEEFLFRSYLLSFTNAYFPLVLSVLINATAFYFIHCNLKIFELIFMGIVFSIITICTNNIFAAIVAHACNNILVYYVYKYIIVRKQKKEIIIKM
jgi:membrane protease YdiL (CAAX protease family)